MKALLLTICLLALAFTAHAADVTLTWDANNESDLAGYRVYQATGSAPDTFTRVQDIAAPATTATVKDLDNTAHNYGLAADCAPLMRGTRHSIWREAPAAAWSKYGEICERHGLTWGGNFRTLSDRPHCEHPRWKIARDEWRKNGCRL